MWSTVDYSLNCDEEFRELSNAAALQELYDSETEKEGWIRKLLPSSKAFENEKHEFLANCSEFPQSVLENDATKKLEKITKETDDSTAQLVKLDGLQSLIESSATWDDEDRKAYSEFLSSLYSPEDKDYGPEDSSDEDFDYLLEVQNETDDEEVGCLALVFCPLICVKEYRNDPTARIPGKELVDLVSGKPSYSFRRSKKCHNMKNSNPKKKPRTQCRQVEEQPVNSKWTPHVSSEFSRAKPIMPANMKACLSHFNSTCSQFHFRQDSLELVSLQVSRHIQLLIQTCLLVGQEPLKDDSALKLSRRMLNDWKRASDICVSYRKFFTETVLEYEPNTTLDRSSVSFFDTPILRIVPDLLSLTDKCDCLQSSDIQKLLETFCPYLDEELFPKLPKYSFYMGSNHSILDAQYIDVNQVKSTLSSEDQWSSAEDSLIATLIREYGSDWLENYERLLPSKQYDEVWRRYRFLSGRHAPDNPVKRLVIERQRPLSSEEWRILEHGVYLYGDNAWKQIEINLLPHRDQVILQRMWKQRQKRRRQKIRENERHKQEARKLAKRLRQQALEEDRKKCEKERCLENIDMEETNNGTMTTRLEFDNSSNWLIVDGDVKVHFSHEDDKKLLSQVRAFGATERTFLALAKILGDGKTPEVIRKRYSQLLWWLQQSTNVVYPSNTNNSETCENS
ncbi:hypothetical protein Gasu_46030 isoform 2 [Galdieria sulphuraria]|uniref:Myb-like domain-containing protein n=1 Tax=Galdieria sulphuraria TaxID=130081 RepID=M2XWF5_GALSU|nr:hypothetical protein Gasu_46030 isoform 2 [Galdieria sulphuraria]EME27943.1 hypothetical protein isoform 2 [Galdieria sulphuraria]|eukprot:XP_005704463.1 hypothetical protein isoform 2 [Galdieria sulphuraria]